MANVINNCSGNGSPVFGVIFLTRTNISENTIYIYHICRLYRNVFANHRLFCAGVSELNYANIPKFLSAILYFVLQYGMLRTR